LPCCTSVQLRLAALSKLNGLLGANACMQEPSNSRTATKCVS
jgi:hypothetical protein